MSAIDAGRSFWEEVKKPFLARDLNRSEVQEIVRWGIEIAGGKYKQLIKKFNLEDRDYHKFMTFLREYKLK